MIEYRDSVEVGVLTGEEGGAAGSADGVGYEGVGEAGAIGGEAVEVRGLVYLGAVSGNGVLGVIVREHENDVRVIGG